MYISPLIDPSSSEGPAYGRIWAGLYFAIVEEVLQRHDFAERERTRQEGSGTAKDKAASALVERPITAVGRKPVTAVSKKGPSAVGKKAASGVGKKAGTARLHGRKSTASENTSRKRGAPVHSNRGARLSRSTALTNVHVPRAPEDGTLEVSLTGFLCVFGLTLPQRLNECFSSRSVLAIYFRIGIFNSPSPLVLLNPGRASSELYEPKEYITLVLESRLGRGATGDVFGARLGPNVALPIGNKEMCLVVKIATTLNKLMRLRHEFNIYCHLRSAGVKGIPHVFGYYQDGTHEAGALIMRDAGTPLGMRRTGPGHCVTVSDTERWAYFYPIKHTKAQVCPSSELRALLKNIHACGVLHGDLRPWNILVDDKGKLTIIDFDRASRKAEGYHYEREEERLERFIDGDEIDAERATGPDDVDEELEDVVLENL